jgi:hypothetical protein
LYPTTEDAISFITELASVDPLTTLTVINNRKPAQQAQREVTGGRVLSYGYPGNVPGYIGNSVTVTIPTILGGSEVPDLSGTGISDVSSTIDSREPSEMKNN